MRYFFLIIALLLPVISEAQLSAPGMGTVRYTSYPSAPLLKILYLYIVMPPEHRKERLMQLVLKVLDLLITHGTNGAT